jgi:hypothetical protein
MVNNRDNKDGSSFRNDNISDSNINCSVGTAKPTPVTLTPTPQRHLYESSGSIPASGIIGPHHQKGR